MLPSSFPSLVNFAPDLCYDAKDIDVDITTDNRVKLRIAEVDTTEMLEASNATEDTIFAPDRDITDI